MNQYQVAFRIELGIKADSKWEAVQRIEDIRKFIHERVREKRNLVMSRASQFTEHLLKKIEAKTGVEIGVFAGEHAEELLKPELGLEKLYLIDPYEAYTEEDRPVAEGEHTFDSELPGKVKEKLKRFGKRVVYIYKPSLKAVKGFKDGSLDFVYIDGNHDYQEVRKDIRVWYPKVRIGGIIGGHDYIGIESVKKAVHKEFGDDVEEAGDDWWHFRKEGK